MVKGLTKFIQLNDYIVKVGNMQKISFISYNHDDLVEVGSAKKCVIFKGEINSYPPV